MNFLQSKITSRKDSQNCSGFTLIEVLLVIAILAILAAVVIIAINPAKQISQAQDAQRRSDVKSILDAVQQYALDNQGDFPGNIPPGATCSIAGQDICQFQVLCDGVDLGELVVDQEYLTELPNDPIDSNDQLTGYKVVVTEAGRISVCTRDLLGNNLIEVTQ